MASERQREYQRKYDKKTETISVKYALCDLKDYDRLIEYLEETGQSRSGFIKGLINDFFKSGRQYQGLYPNKENEKMVFYKYSEISDGSFEKLKEILGEDEEKYNIVLDVYASNTQSEINDALLNKACEFEHWIDTLEDRISDGEINMKSLKQFEKDVVESLCGNLHSIFVDSLLA